MVVSGMTRFKPRIEIRFKPRIESPWSWNIIACGIGIKCSVINLIVCVLIQFVSQTVILYFQRACNNVPEDGHRASWKADFN